MEESPAKVILEGFTRASEQHAEGDGGGQEHEFAPQGVARIRNHYGEQNEDREMDKIERKCGSGKFANDPHGKTSP